MGLAHGTHGWVDVAVPDMDGGTDFYANLFGWEPIDGGGGEAMPYTMFTLEGDLVAGMGPLGPEPTAGQPSVWTSYIIVDDAQAAFDRAVELGATPLWEPTAIMDAGTMAVIMDPVGAVIGLWESGTHGGAEVFNVPGAVTWNDLGCRDVDAAKAFYGELFGWEFAAMEFGEGSTYWTVSNAGRGNGGIWDVSGLLPDEVPAHWLAWFIVEDCESSAARVVELGGSVEREPRASDIGITAVVSDPFGATFGIIATDQTDGQPPR